MGVPLTSIVGILLWFSLILGFIETEYKDSAISVNPKNISPQLQLSDLHCRPCICQLTKDLRLVANCTARNLTSVPNITTKTDVLLLDFNKLLTLEPGCFSKYANLTELNLAFNMITTIQIESFQNLLNLQILNLTGNKLKYTEHTFPRNSFKPLQNLKILLLKKNNNDDDDNNNNNRNNNNNSRTSNDSPSYPDQALNDLTSLEELYMDGLTNQSFGVGFLNLSSLTLLSLSGEDGECSLQFLFNTTFVNVKHIQRLHLSHCDVRHIEPGTFSPLKSSLDVLDLSYNRKLTFSRFGIGSFGLQNSTLRVLNISGIVHKYARCVDITAMDVQFLSNTKIEEIYADDNRIEFFQKGVLQRLPKTLQKVSLENSRFIIGPYMFEFQFLTGLKEISIGGVTKVKHLPSPEPPSILDVAVSTYLEEKASPYGLYSIPTLTSDREDTMQYIPINEVLNDSKVQKYYDITNICMISMFCLPPNLKTLKYTYSQLWYNVTSVTTLPNSLTHADLSYNFLSWLYGPLRGFENITYLNLSHNFVYRVYPTFFENFKSLEILDLSYNMIPGRLLKNTNGRLFEKLESLQVLKLNNNKIHRVSRNMLQGLGNLNILDLSGNGLYDVNLNVKYMHNLHFINLSYNMIRWLPTSLISDLDSISQVPNSSISIDLSFNPITCSCENLYFLKWMLNSKIKQNNTQHYKCLTAEGALIPLSDIGANVAALEKSCINYFYIALGAFSALVLCLCIFFGGVIYRYRWKLRYWYYGAKYHFKQPQVTSENGQFHFEFDAFVSYADEDRAIVVDEMIEMVERRAQKKLIIHQRDFIPGQPIASNIVEAVKKSRKTVLVLSRHFLRSEWCEYEMKMAEYESIHNGRDVLLVLMLEDVPSEMLPKEILHLLQSDSYIEYEHEENSDVFWQRFVEAMGSA